MFGVSVVVASENDVPHAEAESGLERQILNCCDPSMQQAMAKAVVFTKEMDGLVTTGGSEVLAGFGISVS